MEEKHSGKYMQKFYENFIFFTRGPQSNMIFVLELPMMVGYAGLECKT